VHCALWLRLLFSRLLPSLLLLLVLDHLLVTRIVVLLLQLPRSVRVLKPLIALLLQLPMLLRSVC
jgi:hypothetical protein